MRCWHALCCAAADPGARLLQLLSWPGLPADWPAGVLLCLQEDLSHHAPDSEYQQSVVMSVADRDGFNWG